MKQYFILFGLLFLLAGCVSNPGIEFQSSQASFPEYEDTVYRDCQDPQNCRTLLVVYDAENHYEGGIQEDSLEENLVLLTPVGGRVFENQGVVAREDMTTLVRKV